MGKVGFASNAKVYGGDLLFSIVTCLIYVSSVVNCMLSMRLTVDGIVVLSSQPSQVVTAFI